ncbi:meiosis-specific protein ASY3-like [Mangifera indica]|uniref:meiosis-specific protein ASY3-like n=1 Tax=Mangifera indica TaxID=29780 RepID=UPI001CFBA13F|nr:meiosis-specific protein ASY3-like [Mangifera indica]
MSNCQSLCSNYHPSSQSRKISIGITAESLAKKKPVVAKEDETAVLKAEKVNPCNEIFTAANNRSVSAKTAAAEKQTEAPDQVSYPWITTPSLKQNATTSEMAYCRKQASTRPAAGGRQEKINGLKDLQMTHTHSGQFFANKSFILQSGESNPKLFDGMTYKRKGMKSRKSKCAEEFMFTTTQEVLVSDKTVKAGKRDNGENGQTETLRMKLWQILGTVSSPKSQCSNPQSAEVGADRLEPQKVVDQISDTAGRPRQNSDTIEADSESPDQPTRRRLNQSLTRKNCSKVPKTKTKTKIGPSSGNKQKYQKKNIFLFEEGWNAKFIGAADYGSSMFTRKNSHLKGSTIKLHKISFPQKDNANEPKQANYISELPCAEKTSSLSNKVESFHGCMPEDREDCGKSRNTVPVKDSHESPKGAVPAEDFHESPKNAVPVKDFLESPESKNMNHKRDLDDPALTENRHQREDCGKTASRNVVDSPDEILSPTFAFKTPIVSPSPWSTPRTVQMEQDIFSPALEERRHNMGSIRSFRTLRNSKSDCSGSDAETDSPDDAEKLKDSPPRKASPVKGENDSENGQAELSSDGTEDNLGGCSSEDGDPGSSREGSPVINIYDYHKENSPETVTAEKSNFMHCPTNRFCGHGGISFQEFSTPLTSPKGMEETEWFQETPDQNQEDDLDRTITLFAIALDNFRRKMDSETRKKSSEILTSISEGICLQLLDVESQIQTDVGKLTSVSKSKRKHLETRFEEQKEQLELICKKFKEDIHHHLQNFTSTLKVLEADQIELKRKVKKQRTSHQKVLLQLEEAVEAQLSDAQRRITTVHELARKKRLQLKLLIAECLKEGIF